MLRNLWNPQPGTEPRPWTVKAQGANCRPADPKDISFFFAIHFTVFHSCFFFFFNKLQVCGNPAFNKCMFQQHLLTLCLHVTLWWFSQCFKLFHYYYICYDDLWSGIFDVTLYNRLGHHQLHPFKTVNLIHRWHAYFDSFADWLLPHLVCSPWAALFPKTQQCGN